MVVDNISGIVLKSDSFGLITRNVLSFIHFTHGFHSLLGFELTYFLEIVSTTHIFQSGVRNWPASVSRREIEVFNPQV